MTNSKYYICVAESLNSDVFFIKRKRRWLPDKIITWFNKHNSEDPASAAKDKLKTLQEYNEVGGS